MKEYKCNINELKDLLDKKLEEDIISTLFIDSSILEIHKKDENGIYKIRHATFPRKQFRKVVQKELYYNLTDWEEISESQFLTLLKNAHRYLEDIFFEF